MAEEKVAMPGDADEPVDKAKAEHKDARKRAAKPEDKKDEKGPLSPAQHDDDGWGDTPVQMRG